MLQLIHTCTISRNQSVGTNYRTSLQLIASSVKCLALPMTDRTAIQNGFDLGKGYDFYFDSSQDVKVGDKLAWNGNTFAVSGVKSFLVPIVNHLQVSASQEVN